jgi:hypothetical protein
MTNCMTEQELEHTLKFCQEGKVLAETMVTILQENDPAIAVRGYKVTFKSIIGILTFRFFLA